MDNMTKLQRSRTMSKIQSKETRPEIKLRSRLHKDGYRFRKNYKKLPGSPDIVLHKYKTIIMVHGCFWHQHPECSKASIPKSNQEYWINKFNRNIIRDRENFKKLISLGWKVLIVWECEVNSNFESIYLDVMEIINSQNLPDKIAS